MPSLPPFAYEPRGRKAPGANSRRLRFWSVRRAGFLERVYDAIERLVLWATPRVGWLDSRPIGKLMAFAERHIKGALFDCRMCGDCLLSSTGMSCPMNCPKALRNGPCGGVRADGGCEVYPEMPCVWVKAYEGSRLMRRGDRIRALQAPIDHRLKGSSAWLNLAKRAKVRP
jgi:hypothetical protein